MTNIVQERRKTVFRNIRWFSIASIVVLTALLLAACAPAAPSPTAAPEATPEPAATPTPPPTAAPPPEAPESIEIGAVVPLTGKYGGGGAQVQAGYEYGVADVNAAGGVYVKEYDAQIPLRLTLLDDESDPTKTVSRLETLYSEQNVVAYLGGFGSDLHAAAAAIAEKNETPYLGVAFALWQIHQQGYTYLFSPFWKSPDIGDGVYEFLNEMLPEGERPTKVAIFQETTDWGIELGGLWKDYAPEYGYDVVVYEEYTPGAGDFSDLILTAKEAGAETLLALPSPPDGMAMFKQMSELGWTPKFSLIIRAPDAVSWTEALGAIGDYVGLCPGWHHGVDFPGVDELNQNHEADFGRPSDVMVGPSYAIVQILADAIERAGTLDREAIRDAIAATDMMTVVGPVTFREDGTGVVMSPIIQWQQGATQLVWPVEHATADFVYPAPPFEER
jgi:branched-chain amino acid transport system substrate-binding protein